MITIYLIRNLINGKPYVGQTVSTIQKRFTQHKSKARTEAPGGCWKLNRALRKYGFDNFTIEQIDNAETQQQADDLESYYIVFYDTIKHGYNVCPQGTAHPCAEETKKKLSIIRTGTHHTEEAKKLISEATKGENNPFYGKTHSEETKQLISESNSGNTNWLGKHHTDETKELLSKKAIESGRYVGENNPFYGKTHSEEVRKIISISNKNRILSEETRTKTSIRMRGENNPNTKLTQIQIDEIRRLLSESNSTSKQIAEQFDVSVGTIRNIKSGKTWKSKQ